MVTSIIYITTVKISHWKKLIGKAIKPIECPKLVNGMIVSPMIPMKVKIVSGAEARLCKNGILGVRIIWITKV